MFVSTEALCDALVELELTYLMCIPFELLHSGPLRLMTLKTIFFIAITSARPDQIFVAMCNYTFPDKLVFWTQGFFSSESGYSLSYWPGHHTFSVLCSTSSLWGESWVWILKEPWVYILIVPTNTMWVTSSLKGFPEQRMTSSAKMAHLEIDCSLHKDLLPTGEKAAHKACGFVPPGSKRLLLH